jgi:acetyltransferase
MRPQPIADPQSRMAPSRAYRPAVTVIERPLGEAEWDLVRAFVRRLEREDLRLRFGHPLNFGDEATLRRVFDIKAGCGEISWLHDEPAVIAGLTHRVMVSRAEAEVGLIVRSDVRRTGIGEFLLRAMLARSARSGLETLNGSVLLENRAMLRLAAKVGFMPRQVCTFTAELTFDLGRANAATVIR